MMLLEVVGCEVEKVLVVEEVVSGSKISGAVWNSIMKETRLGDNFTIMTTLLSHLLVWGILPSPSLITYVRINVQPHALVMYRPGRRE